MKVKELIEILSKYDETLEVLIYWRSEFADGFFEVDKNKINFDEIHDFVILNDWRHHGIQETQPD